MSNQQNNKIVYFVRHGESEANASPHFQGPDSPLTEKGKKQASFIADRFSRISFDKLIASPFERAKETAEAIAAVTGKTPEYSDLFVERLKPSSINGKAYEDETANRTWREWETTLYTPGIKVEDGENFDDILARADKALEFLAAHSESSLVVVTHGYFLRTIEARVLLGDALTASAFKNFQRSIDIENTGLTVLKLKEAFEEEARWRLWIHNDHSHLG